VEAGSCFLGGNTVIKRGLGGWVRDFFILPFYARQRKFWRNDYDPEWRITGEELMLYHFAQQCFEFFFQVDYPITWIYTVSDARFRLHSSVPSDHDTRYAVKADSMVDHDLRVAIFNVEDMEHDIKFCISSVSRSDMRYVVGHSGAIDHHTRFRIEAAGVDMDHAAQFVVREEDFFTN
jgi:hypothetical protein